MRTQLDTHPAAGPHSSAASATSHVPAHPATAALAQPVPAHALQWRYPFPGKGGGEETDPHVFYHALGGMDDGFFPLGVNGFPHGGVHFGDGSSSRVDQSGGVRLCADGEIVAFRLDHIYPQLRFPLNSHRVMYSTGFVLVRHRLTLPPAPGSTGTQPADETLTFFTLAMHLADWDTCQANDAVARPGWWPGVDAYRVTGRDHQEGEGVAGTFVWSEPKAGARPGQYAAGKHVAFLPHGCEVVLGERRGPWGRIRAVTSGAMISVRKEGASGTDGRHAQAKASPLREGDFGWINFHEQQPVREPEGVGRVVIPPQPIAVRAGTLLGQFGQYLDQRHASPLPARPVRPLVHLEMFAGEGLAAFLVKSRGRAAQLPASTRTILSVQPGTKLVQPGKPDFSFDGDFHPADQLELCKDSPATGPWVKVQPMRKSRDTGLILDFGEPVWVERKYQERFASPPGLPAWEEFPLQSKTSVGPLAARSALLPRAQLDASEVQRQAVDDRGVHWWKVWLATSATDSNWGWLCEKDHAGTQWESPWAWPGFGIVDATGIDLADAFRRNLVVTGSGDPLEQQRFAPSIEAVNGSALLQRLEQTVARLPVPNSQKDARGKDGSEVVTAAKLQRAMNERALASELAHVILRYESEWGGNMARWEALTPLMEQERENWECELQRIRKLQWWDEVKGKVEGFPDSPVVHHVHPVAMVGNFSTSCKCVNYEAIWVDNPSPAYRNDQIVAGSHYSLPIDTTVGRLAGNSRRAGDASKQAQTKVIDILIDKARIRCLEREDIAMILAMTRHESGFNPDAAAGTTSASGLGQFVDKTARAYGIHTDADRFDADRGAEAMVEHYIENKRLAQKNGVKERDVLVMTYAYHHDGPTLAYGGREISQSKVMPWFDKILENICASVASDRS